MDIDISRLEQAGAIGSRVPFGVIPFFPFGWKGGREERKIVSFPYLSGFEKILFV